MRKRLALAMASWVLISMSGCIWPLNWSVAHNKRHFRRIWIQWKELETDIDAVIFGLERYPADE
ncbi:MAG: hypothetical protein O6952_03525 [Planctomycetota bacterium]|nr:hypothetical protein [Planctomycetota bacterium]MCZ6690536.1 hypothetical protein [Planctomycetota bacterium]